MYKPASDKIDRTELVVFNAVQSNVLLTKPRSRLIIITLKVALYS